MTFFSTADIAEAQTREFDADSARNGHVDDMANTEYSQDADEQLIAAFVEVETREKRETAVVELPRFIVPKRDRDGNLIRDDSGAVTTGPMELYFRRLDPSTLQEISERHTRREEYRDARGRMVSERTLDNTNYAPELIYLSLVEWCRKQYFDNRKLWGRRTPGNGRRFLAMVLNLREKEACSQAIESLEGFDGEATARLVKKL